MTEPTNKKRGAVAARKKNEIRTVVEAWEVLQEGTPIVYKSLADFITGLDAPEDVMEIYTSVYYRSAELENRFVVPQSFKTLNADRNGNGAITALYDENDGFTDSALNEVLALSAMKEKGYKKVVMVKGEDGRVEALAIPNAVQMEEADDVKGKKDFHDEVWWIYTTRSVMTVYAPIAQVTTILGMDAITISDVNTVLKSLNALCKMEDPSAIDLEALSDFTKLKTEIASHEGKITRRNFLNTLFAISIGKMESEEKVKHFVDETTYTLANSLGFSLPHGGPCFTKLGTKLIETVPLGSLGDDDNVLMCNSVISQGDYLGIRGDISTYPVYVDNDQLGAKKGNKWVEMPGKVLEQAGLLTSFLSAIADGNKSKENPGAITISGKATKSKFKAISLD